MCTERWLKGFSSSFDLFNGSLQKDSGCVSFSGNAAGVAVDKSRCRSFPRTYSASLKTMTRRSPDLRYSGALSGYRAWCSPWPTARRREGVNSLGDHKVEDGVGSPLREGLVRGVGPLGGGVALDDEAMILKRGSS